MDGGRCDRCDLPSERQRRGSGNRPSESVRSHAEAVVDRSSYLADPSYLWDPASSWNAGLLAGDEARLASLDDFEPGDPAAAADRKSTPPRIRFDIAGGRLAVVLAAYSAATGIEVELAEAALGEIESVGVVGTYTPGEALNRLLGGTGAEHHFLDEKNARVALRVAVSEEIDVVDRGVRIHSPKHTEPLLDTPQSVTVVDAELIQAQGATTLRDVLRNVTGISIQAGEGGGGLPGDNLAIRGFTARNDIFVDGVRDFGAYSRDPYNIEQVEVTKGPASVFGGRGSTGGAINLATKVPDLASGVPRLGRRPAPTTSSAPRVDLNQPLPDGMMRGAAFRLNLMYTQGDAPGRDAVESERYGIAPSLASGSMGDDAPVAERLAARRGQPCPTTAFPGCRRPTSRWRPTPTSRRRSTSTTSTASTTATTRRPRPASPPPMVEHDLASDATLRSLVRGGRSERDSVITSPRFASNNSTDLNRQLQARDLDDDDPRRPGRPRPPASGPAASSHALVTGVEVSRETAENRARTGPTAPLADLFDPDPHAPYAGPIVHTGARTENTADTAAAYAFDTMQLGERFELMGGLRYDRSTSTSTRCDVDGALTNFERDRRHAELARRAWSTSRGRRAASTPPTARRSTPRPRATPD